MCIHTNTQKLVLWDLGLLGFVCNTKRNTFSEVTELIGSGGLIMWLINKSDLLDRLRKKVSNECILNKSESKQLIFTSKNVYKANLMQLSHVNLLPVSHRMFLVCQKETQPSAQLIKINLSFPDSIVSVSLLSLDEVAKFIPTLCLHPRTL